MTQKSRTHLFSTMPKAIGPVVSRVSLASTGTSALGPEIGPDGARLGPEISPVGAHFGTMSDLVE